jgi:hypothetical protein
MKETGEREVGRFDFEQVSPGIDGPRFVSFGGGYPNQVADDSTRVDVLGAGIMPLRELRALQESSRPGYAMIGGSRHRGRSRRRSRRSNNSRKKKSRRAH